MHYNFDEIVDRTNTSCYKYDLRDTFFNDPDVLPMWVADMDFRTPDFILNAVRKRLEHEIIGYTYHAPDENQSITNWIFDKHQWKIENDWIGFAPGVVPALCFAIYAFTEPGDKIVIQPPVYFPFFSVVTDHKRTLVQNPLVLENGRYRMDLDHLVSQIDDRTKLLFLCSPHNPTGNVWTRQELMELGEICIQKNIIIISDEIHSDIVYPGFKHIPIAAVDEKIADNTITLMAPSKTFNMAGLSTSFFIASNKLLFEKMNRSVENFHVGAGNIFGNIAMEAAYRMGKNWLSQLTDYLKGNIDFARQFINNEIPLVTMIEPEATFLLWLDFRRTGMNDSIVRKKLISEARVGLSNGIIFGKEGKCFQRINIGCPRAVLEKGLRQISLMLNKKP